MYMKIIANFRRKFFCSFFPTMRKISTLKSLIQKLDTINVDDCLLQDPDLFVDTAFGTHYVNIRY